MFLGKQFLKIDKWFPSSKTCSKSGNLKGHLKLPDSNYKCECCGIEIDRVKMTWIIFINWSYVKKSEWYPRILHRNCFWMAT